ncbi:hypothetical protein GKE82_06570 [Conexibacter sp. W3-3-2]|uniref:MOSC domain-containing protein n=1 Tax=Paraconexibacter algicola TaxID=2133960 RepID=A0A2T4UE04_9ACTN|nr:MULTISPECIES: MOSC domain-containing protein [Solirubrobacterales]MTD43974.1 hypothetical protein [Conexibacter sp. W3-3-2]PTL55705.1 hypothetical protein C7Y72_18925 [Paraconexibacter algicola]
MRQAPPPDGWSDRSAASLAACLATVLDVDTAAVAIDPFELDPGSGYLRGWLAERGLGLVPVDDPEGFGWAGPWIAAIPDHDPEAHRWVVVFGNPAPAGVVWDPLRPDRQDGPADELLEGYVIAQLAPRLEVKRRGRAAEPGTITAIVVAPDAGAPCVEVPHALAIPGRGLEGDRYAAGRGTFSRGTGYGRDITLVEEELLAVARVDGLPITPVQARRNVAVSGIVLDDLIGERFLLGTAECIGRRRCEPCAHLQRLGPPGILRALVHRGGLRADIVVGGEIAVGDLVVPKR